MQGHTGPKHRASRSLIALGVMVAILAITSLAGLSRAQGATSLQVPTPTPTYYLPTPTPTPTRTPTPTPTATPFQDKPQPKLSGPLLMKPFPTVRTAGNYNPRRTQLTRVKVTGPRGARVEGRCTKIARKCRTNVTIPKKRTLRLKRLERKYKPGASIRIRVMTPGLYGKYVVIKVRKGKLPVRRDRCIKPDTRKPVACPSS